MSAADLAARSSSVSPASYIGNITQIDEQDAKMPRNQEKIQDGAMARSREFGISRRRPPRTPSKVHRIKSEMERKPTSKRNGNNEEN